MYPSSQCPQRKNHPDIVVFDEHQRNIRVVIDVVILSDSNIREKEHKKFDKYQGLREKLEMMWSVKATVVPLVIRELGAVTSKPGWWLQQIPGTTSEISAVLGTLKIPHRTPGPELEQDTSRPGWVR